MQTVLTCRDCGATVLAALPFCLVCHAYVRDAPDYRRLPFWLATLVVVATVASLLHLVGLFAL
jgi:hypothetical protein